MATGASVLGGVARVNLFKGLVPGTAANVEHVLIGENGIVKHVTNANTESPSPAKNASQIATASVWRGIISYKVGTLVEYSAFWWCED